MGTTTTFTQYRTDLPHGHKDRRSHYYLMGMVASLCERGIVSRHRKHGEPLCRAAVKCEIKDESGVVGVGWALCSMSENFVRKTGRRIAIGRAKKDLALKRAQPFVPEILNV